MIECKNGFNSPPLPVSKPLTLLLRSSHPLSLWALANRMRRELCYAHSSLVLKRICTSLSVLLYSWACLSLCLSFFVRTHPAYPVGGMWETCRGWDMWKILKALQWRYQKMRYTAAWPENRYMTEPRWNQIFPDKPNLYWWPTKLWAKEIILILKAKHIWDVLLCSIMWQ